MTCYIVHIPWLYIGHFCYATDNLPPSPMTLNAVPRRWLPGTDGDTKEPIPLYSLDTLRCIIQSGMFGDNGNQPSQAAISRMKDNVLYLVLGGCHTLAAWRAATKDPVRLSHVVVDSDYTGAFREDYWLPQVNDVYTEPIIFISSCAGMCQDNCGRIWRLCICYVLLTMSDLEDELCGATTNSIYLVKIVNAWYTPWLFVWCLQRFKLLPTKLQEWGDHIPCVLYLSLNLPLQKRVCAVMYLTCNEILDIY